MDNQKIAKDLLKLAKSISAGTVDDPQLDRVSSTEWSQLNDATNDIRHARQIFTKLKRSTVSELSDFAIDMEKELDTIFAKIDAF